MQSYLLCKIEKLGNRDVCLAWHLHSPSYLVMLRTEINILVDRRRQSAGAYDVMKPSIQNLYLQRKLRRMALYVGSSYRVRDSRKCLAQRSRAVCANQLVSSQVTYLSTIQRPSLGTGVSIGSRLKFNTISNTALWARAFPIRLLLGNNCCYSTPGQADVDQSDTSTNHAWCLGASMNALYLCHATSPRGSFYLACREAFVRARPL